MGVNYIYPQILGLAFDRKSPRIIDPGGRCSRPLDSPFEGRINSLPQFRTKRKTLGIHLVSVPFCPWTFCMHLILGFLDKCTKYTIARNLIEHWTKRTNGNILWCVHIPRTDRSYPRVKPTRAVSVRKALSCWLTASPAKPPVTSCTTHANFKAIGLLHLCGATLFLSEKSSPGTHFVAAPSCRFIFGRCTAETCYEEAPTAWLLEKYV